MTTGASFGASSLRQEMGLGPKARIREVEIRWPASGHIQRLGPLAARQFLEIREGDPRPVPVPLKPFRLSTGSGH